MISRGRHRIRRAGGLAGNGAGKYKRGPRVQKKDASRNQTLGAYLFHVRKIKRLTLREVERATMQEVSNSYLSQLEHDRIINPSPNILNRLAEVYRISYLVLMEKAGYAIAPLRRGTRPNRFRVATFATEGITAKEEEELLRYLAFLRSRGSGKT